MLAVAADQNCAQTIESATMKADGSAWRVYGYVSENHRVISPINSLW